MNHRWRSQMRQQEGGAPKELCQCERGTQGSLAGGATIADLAQAS